MKELQPCGTPAAYKRHRRAGEEPCEACRDAQRAADRARYRRDRPVKVRGPSRRQRHRQLLAERAAQFEREQAELERLRAC